MEHNLSPYQIEAELFIALGHPVRLEILNVLKSGEVCVCHIQAVLNQRQAYISQHINVLRNAGLVSARKEGQRVYYQIRDPGIYKVLDHFTDLLKYEGRWQGEAEPEEMLQPKDCHCPRCSGHDFEKEAIRNVNH